MSISFLRISEKQVRYVITAFALVIATIAPALVPGLVSAAQLTERSIALSNSSASATNVTYDVNFTAAADAGAFVVDFCSNSPVVGSTCTAPTGFSASAAASATSGFTDVSALDANTVVVAGTIDVSTEDQISVELTGVNNPTVSGALYARIVTYVADTDADLYDSVTLGTNAANAVDDGGVAMEITDTIGVSGAVLETLSFCISSEEILIDCDVAPDSAPVLELGETVGDVIALTPSAVSEGSIFTQISTNAVSGAVVSLKSSATGCGGLLRAGAPTECDILPALTGGIVSGQARFGVKTATATDSAGATVAGDFVPVTGSGYNNTTYALNYAADDLSGVTSNYGDPFLDTAGAPVNNKNMELTFGASISNETPAGLYSTNLSLIATGRY